MSSDFKNIFIGADNSKRAIASMLEVKLISENFSLMHAIF